MSFPSKIELLAPAGEMASFHAALKNGADAVYLGARAFGARSSAGFDDDALGTAIRTAHLYGKRVYVAVNTLIKQHELAEVAQLIGRLDQLEADALIVQDLGLLHFIRERYPHFPIHASTQMSIHNASGAQLLLGEGVQRVVLARECSLDTIKQVAATGIETEVFVHGALCISVSGQCLLSSQIGGRSGNRGRCAQPCRMQYTYRGKQGAWLSPRDIAQIEHIPDLAAAGVHSLKIEGRLKRPEYVAVVTKAYRQALDQYHEGRYAVDVPHRMEDLLQIFQRGGFTPSWTFGHKDAQIINPKRVSHDGLLLGKVIRSQRKGNVWLSDIQLSRALVDGDHLQIRSKQEQEMVYSGPSVDEGATAVIRHHMPAQDGDHVYRLSAALQLGEARQSMEKPYPAIPVNAALRVATGHPALLEVRHEGTSFVAEGDVAQAAQTRPMTKESTEKAIRKSGDSPFDIASYTFYAQDDCFLPVSSLNALRRNALQGLEEAIIAAHPRVRTVPKAHVNTMGKPPKRHDETNPALYVRCHHADWLPALREAGANHILYAPQDYTAPDLSEQCTSLSDNDYFCLPRQTTEQTLRWLLDFATGNQLSVQVDNVGHLDFSWPRDVLAGPGIPAWNREALAFLKGRGCSAVVLSTELSRTELADMEAGVLPGILPVYGRVAVMQLNHCPERTFRNLSGDQRACRLCAAGEGTLGRSLTDKMGAAYPLYPFRLPEGCLNTMLFHTPLNLSKKAMGSRWLLDFTTESKEEAVSITRYYAALLTDQSPVPDLPVPVYAGRYEEGVL